MCKSVFLKFTFLSVLAIVSISDAAPKKSKGQRNSPEENRSAWFDQMDSNKDGMLSRDEFLAVHKKIAEKRGSVENKESVATPKKKQGVAKKRPNAEQPAKKPAGTKKMKGKQQTAKSPTKSEIQYAEKKYDKNNDGKLSSDETLAMIREHNKTRSVSTE